MLICNLFSSDVSKIHLSKALPNFGSAMIRHHVLAQEQGVLNVLNISAPFDL